MSSGWKTKNRGKLNPQGISSPLASAFGVNDLLSIVTDRLEEVTNPYKFSFLANVLSRQNYVPIVNCQPINLVLKTG